MAEIIYSFEITLAQISGAYIRYLPFSRELSEEKISLLRKSFLIWSLADFVINLFLFSDEISYRTFKIALLVFWLPYFMIATKIIGKISKQIFAFGMEGLWVFMVHAFAGMGVALIHGQMSEEFLPLQIQIYLLLFVGLLWVERKFFINLFPTTKFFEDKALRWTISILPVAIFIGTTIQIMEVTFLQTWPERAQRLFFPIFFLLIYRLMSITTQKVEEKQLQERKNQILKRQMNSLEENNALLEKNQREVTELKENLLENYTTLENLINAGKTAEAMEFIGRQVKILDSTRIKQYSKLPLINAAISVYFRRAENFGIKTISKVDLPEKILTDESELAVLVSNLLENAIAASLKQKNSSPREISIILRSIGGQNVLEIENRYDLPIKLGENGLPYTTKIGHGLGMSSLEMFAKKYNAFVDFSQENGFVRVNLYWNDYLSEPEEKNRVGWGAKKWLLSFKK